MNATQFADRGLGPAPEMESAVWAVLGRGLRGESSAIDATVRTWCPEVASELQRRVEHNPDEGDRGFLDKLHDQLHGAPDDVVVLAAELLYIHAAPLMNVGADTKLSRIATVLGWASSPRALPDHLVQGLRARAAFNGGMGFNVQMWRQLIWLCRFVITWGALTDDQRQRALADPWAFRETTASVPHDMQSMRYSLEYLAWPGVFPVVTSIEHRRRIAAAMADDIGGLTGSDDLSLTRDLVTLRRTHAEVQNGTFPYWYGPPYRTRWVKPGPSGPRAWLVRPSEGGSALVATWRADGFVSLKAEMLGDVEPGAPRKDVEAAIRAGYAHLDLSQQKDLAAAYHAFLSMMSVDDIVATLDRDHLIVGTVTGPAVYADDVGSRLRREVGWVGTPIPAKDLLDPIPAQLEQQGNVVDLTAVYRLLKPIAEGDPDSEDATDRDGEDAPAEEVVPDFPAVTSELAQSVHMDAGPLQAMADLLHTRHQLLLYGPPGTGKTYVAKALARHLTGDPSRVRLVQFHPSYAYEDFFEGYRPTLTDAGQPGFELRPGPLRQIAGEASAPENRQNVYILIIDEMNRANLAKVFGELYFLLEYRKDTVRLQYSPDETFRLPLNLFLIGTMNTTDRSIALMDAAIRRRFPFYEMHPGRPPVAGVLARYVAAQGQATGAGSAGDERVALLRALNDAMGTSGHDLHIGPSYLMRDGLDQPDRLAEVWRYDILPLLEEHFYGHKSREEIERTFGLSALRRRLTTNAVGQDVMGPSDAVRPDDAETGSGPEPDGPA